MLQRRKNGMQARREWESLNFKREALHAIKTPTLLPIQQEKLENLIQGVESEIKAKKKKPGIYVRLGCESVLFFLQHPIYISKMKDEMEMRRQMRFRGQDVRNEELNNAVLRAHCYDQSARIFERNNESGAGDWSWNFCLIRHNYTETMGRACQAADYAQSTLQALKVITPPKLQKQTPPPPSSVRDEDYIPVSNEMPNYWSSFQRPSEEEVNDLLNNRCDDNVVGDTDVIEPLSTPKKIIQHTYRQAVFDFARTR